MTACAEEGKWGGERSRLLKDLIIFSKKRRLGT